MEQSQVEELLPRVMSHVEWKTPAQITSDLNKRVKAKDQDEHISLAQVFLALEKAEDERWVENRLVDAPKSLGNPSGMRREFRLIGAGRRVKVVQKETQTGFGGLMPKPA